MSPHCLVKLKTTMPS